MELSFIASALRRRFWLLPLGLVLGLVLGSVLPSKSAPVYEARTVLLIQPPQNTLGGSTFVNDPDRYVIGQLSVLQSSELAARLADKFPGESTGSILSAVTVSQEPKTDIVTVTARSVDPSKAERIANGWAELYMSDLRDRASASQGPALDSVKRQLDDLNTQLTTLNQTVSEQQKIVADQTALITALTSTTGITINAQTNAQIIEARRAIAAATAAATEAQGRSQLLIQQYNQLLTNRSQLELAANLRVASEIVQPALVPSVPTSSSSNLVAAVGAIAGLLAGFVAAIVWARLSPRLVATEQVEQLLGTPVVGRIGRVRAFGAPLAEQVARPLPDRVRPIVHQLCVRAEARGAEGRPVRIAVIGSMHGAGATTVATAMATQFASTGARVVLIDADQHDPEVTRAFGASEQGGIPALLAKSFAADAGRARNGDARGARETATRGSRAVDSARQAFTDTERHEIKVLGFGSDEKPTLRREDLQRIVEETERAAGNAQMLVIDGGALMAAASTVQLAQIADAVVVVVPFNRQRAAALTDVAAQLHDVELLPVLTVASSRPRPTPMVLRAGEVGEPTAEVVDPTEEREATERPRPGRRAVRAS